jgi:hypothetical protein
LSVCQLPPTIFFLGASCLAGFSLRVFVASLASFFQNSPQFFFTFRAVRPKPSDEESEAFGQSVRSLRTFLGVPKKDGQKRKPFDILNMQEAL